MVVCNYEDTKFCEFGVNWSICGFKFLDLKNPYCQWSCIWVFTYSVCTVDMYEIFQMEINGVASKIAILRKAIADLLRTLLSQLDDVNVKCATQLIKVLWLYRIWQTCTIMLSPDKVLMHRTSISGDFIIHCWTTAHNL